MTCNSYQGIDSINNGKFKGGHDNLQQFNLTWTHRFNEAGTFFTTTEAYYIYQSQAPVGGTVNNGPPRPWYTLGPKFSLCSLLRRYGRISR